MVRHDGRAADQLRDYKFETGFIKTAEGSVLVSCGDTKVIVTAKVEDSVPPWMKAEAKAKGKDPHGWVTAEYSMLPGSSNDRIHRERKGPSGRTAEIQRLIGRSIRAMIDIKRLPAVTIQIDCDVIQADGGTRTASITGAYVAVLEALKHLKAEGTISGELPVLNQVAAVSVGIVDGTPVLDLDYPEDSRAQADSNFVLTADGKIIEIQGTAEDGPFTVGDFESMFALARKGIKELCELQNQASLCTL